MRRKTYQLFQGWWLPFSPCQMHQKHSWVRLLMSIHILRFVPILLKFSKISHIFPEIPQSNSQILFGLLPCLATSRPGFTVCWPEDSQLLLVEAGLGVLFSHLHNHLPPPYLPWILLHPPWRTAVAAAADTTHSKANFMIIHSTRKQIVPSLTFGILNLAPLKIWSVLWCWLWIEL